MKFPHTSNDSLTRFFIGIISKRRIFIAKFAQSDSHLFLIFFRCWLDRDRNHRLWELFLTNEAHFAADHVHDDAEKIEHVLGENVVMEIERKLKFPKKDPHGKPIPSLEDLSFWGMKQARQSPTGYGGGAQAP